MCDSSISTYRGTRWALAQAHLRSSYHALLCLVVTIVFHQASFAQSNPKQDSLRIACEQSAKYSDEFSGRAVLVMHQGKIVYEHYNQWEADTPHMLASGTKSFSGVLAMFAIADNLLTLDEKVCTTLTEWKDDPKKNQITVRHLLTLSSGLDPADAAFPTRGQGLMQLRDGLLRERQQRIQRQDQTKKLADLATGDWFADALKVPSKSPPGQRFEYGPSHFYAFGSFLQRKLENQNDIPARTVEAYAKLRIMDPLGISIGRWGRDQRGNVNLPGGLSLTAQNWAKFGQFVLDQGSIRDESGNKKQHLDPELLALCFVPSKSNSRYGLTWWLNGVDTGADSGIPSSNSPQNRGTIQERLRENALNREVDLDDDSAELAMPIFMAAGLGKQRLFVIPRKELVIVRFAEPTREGSRFGNAAFLKPILVAVEDATDPAPHPSPKIP